MHTDTGEIIGLSEEEAKQMFQEYGERRYRSMARMKERRFSEERKMVELTDEEAETLEPMTPQKRKGWMRNQPCVCGSGKKFKKCCWRMFS